MKDICTEGKCLSRCPPVGEKLKALSLVVYEVLEGRTIVSYTFILCSDQSVYVFGDVFNSVTVLYTYIAH